MKDVVDGRDRRERRSAGTTPASAAAARGYSGCGRTRTGRGCCPSFRNGSGSGARVTGYLRPRVHAPGPREVSAAVVALRPLPLEQRLRAAVPALLSRDTTRRCLCVCATPSLPAQKPSVQPRSWRRQQMSTSSPATRNCGSKPPTASRASFQNAMLQPGMCSAILSETRTWIGPPGPLAIACESGRRRRRRDVRPPDTGVIFVEERRHEVAEPMSVRNGVVVEKRDDVAARRVDPGVPRRAEPLILGADQLDVELCGDRAGAVSRAVVDDDRLEDRDSRAVRYPRGSPRSSPPRCGCTR